MSTSGPLNASLPTLAPLAALIVLICIAAGTSAASHLITALGRLGRGYPGTTALICAALMGLALLIAATISHPSAINSRFDDGSFATLLHWTVAAVIALLVDALFAAVGTAAAVVVVGVCTVLIQIALLSEVAGFLGAQYGPGPAALSIAPVVLLSGTAWGGMLLGHWYLVTPSMSFKPLRQSVWLIFASLGVQSAAIAMALLTGPAANVARVVSGDQAFLFWVLVCGSLVFTAGVNALTYYFARTRANQPATAMLYVLIITVMMATVPALLIFLQTGVGV